MLVWDEYFPFTCSVISHLVDCGGTVDDFQCEDQDWTKAMCWEGPPAGLWQQQDHEQWPRFPLKKMLLSRKFIASVGSPGTQWNVSYLQGSDFHASLAYREFPSFFLAQFTGLYRSLYSNLLYCVRSVFRRPHFSLFIKSNDFWLADWNLLKLSLWFIKYCLFHHARFCFSVLTCFQLHNDF